MASSRAGISDLPAANPQDDTPRPPIQNSADAAVSTIPVRHSRSRARSLVVGAKHGRGFPSVRAGWSAGSCAGGHCRIADREVRRQLDSFGYRARRGTASPYPIRSIRRFCWSARAAGRGWTGAGFAGDDGNRGSRHPPPFGAFACGLSSACAASEVFRFRGAAGHFVLTGAGHPFHPEGGSMREGTHT